MKRGIIAAVALGVLVVAGGVGFRVYRGDVGSVSAAAPVPEFSTLDADRWANGAPTSLASAKGEVVFVEGWSPG
jgi:hypothetical protein